jgi:transposase-like protein
MGRKTEAADRTVKDIRRQTRKRYSSEEKIRVVLAGLRGEDSIAESYAVRKVSRRVCTTAGRRYSRAVNARESAFVGMI